MLVDHKYNPVLKKGAGVRDNKLLTTEAFEEFESQRYHGEGKEKWVISSTNSLGASKESLPTENIQLAAVVKAATD